MGIVKHTAFACTYKLIIQNLITIGLVFRVLYRKLGKQEIKQRVR